jgi:hypothetical protein
VAAEPISILYAHLAIFSREPGRDCPADIASLLTAPPPPGCRFGTEEVRAPLALGWRGKMLDMILVAGGIGFFVVAVLYAFACERM